MVNFPTDKRERPFCLHFMSRCHEKARTREVAERRGGGGIFHQEGGMFEVRGPRGGIFDKLVLIASSRVNQVERSSRALTVSRTGSCPERKKNSLSWKIKLKFKTSGFLCFAGNVAGSERDTWRHQIVDTRQPVLSKEVSAYAKINKFNFLRFVWQKLAILFIKSS